MKSTTSSRVAWGVHSGLPKLIFVGDVIQGNDGDHVVLAGKPGLQAVNLVLEGSLLSAGPAAPGNQVLKGLALPQIELARLDIGLLADLADRHLVYVMTLENG